jgi:hypothetical protein
VRQICRFESNIHRIDQMTNRAINESPNQRGSRANAPGCQ